MRRFSGWGGLLGGLAAFTLAALCLPRTAEAQTIGLYNNNTFTYDGLNFTVSNCTVNGVSCSSSSPAAVITELGTAGGAQLGVGWSGGAVSVASGSPNNTLVYTLTVTKGAGSTSRTTVTSSSLAILGSETVTSSGATATNYLADISGGATFTGAPGATALNVNASATHTGGTTTFTSSPLTSGGGSFAVTDTLSLNTSGLSTGYTLSLSRMTQTFSKAPEPLSIGVFLLGLAGLGAARRRWTTKRRVTE